MPPIKDDGRSSAILFTVATILSIASPLWIRGTGLGPLTAVHPPSTVTALPVEHPRVVLLCLDGASLDVISPAVAAGRLPNFGRMLDAGASMHLATTRPTQPEPVWASIMTGMWPSRHGVRGSSRYRPFNGDAEFEVLPDYVFSQALVRVGLLVEEPYSSASLETQPLWRIAARIRRANRVDRPASDASRHRRQPASSSAIGFIVEPIAS